MENPDGLVLNIYFLQANQISQQQNCNKKPMKAINCFAIFSKNGSHANLFADGNLLETLYNLPSSSLFRFANLFKTLGMFFIGISVPSIVLKNDGIPQEIHFDTVL